jgi:hypothetical protein
MTLERKQYCCEMMTFHLNQQCSIHADLFDCPDSLIFYSTQHNTYGIIIHDGGTSYIEITYCPWCGIKLSTFQPDPSVA